MKLGANLSICGNLRLECIALGPWAPVSGPIKHLNRSIPRLIYGELILRLQLIAVLISYVTIRNKGIIR